MSKMATRAVLADTEWEVVDLHWEHGPSPIQCVYRCVCGEREPWVIVAQSALMKRLGLDGLGLYAARKFSTKQGNDAIPKDRRYIGRYDGTVIGKWPSRKLALSSTEARHLHAHGHDKLITLNGGMLVDGENGGPPFLHRMNDAKGSRYRKNVALTSSGWAMILRSSIPAFDLSKDAKGNINSELRVDYNEEYWNYGQGTSSAPVDLTY